MRLRLRRKRWLVVVVLAGAAAGTALAQVVAPAAPTYVPESATSCWECHADGPVGGAPPLRTFATLAPPLEMAAPPGIPFDYPVTVTNAWSGQLTYLEPRLDLTAAPRLSFAADVPPVHVEVDDVIPLGAARPTGPSSRELEVRLPDGLTRLSIRIEPADPDPVTGPDLVLRLRVAGKEVAVDRAGRGGVEEFAVGSRDGFAGLGYGNWTIVAEVTPVPLDPARLGNASLALGEVPFRLVADGASDGAPERVLGLPMAVALPAGRSLVATFRLVAATAPGPGVAEEARLGLWAHTHYAHKQPTRADQDDADFALPEVPVHVRGVAGQVVVSSSAMQALPPLIHNGATMATVAEAVGYTSGFLLLSSTAAGGMFGKASRRGLNGVFGSAKRRVAFHNFVSYGLILAAVGHTVLFLVEATYAWTAGLLWGGLAILAMLGLGLTGALQVPVIRRWSFGAWRWSHFALAIGALLFTAAHITLDGVHFSDVQAALGWQDPLQP